jgi:drug/metabolite transporter (DMT)-like permease
LRAADILRPLTTHKLTGKTLKIVSAFGLVYVIWGSIYLAIRVGVETIPPFLVGGVRLLTSGVVMLVIAVLRHEGLRISRTDAAYAGAAGLGEMVLL